MVSRGSTPQDGLIPPLAPQLGAPRAWPGPLPLGKIPLNWTHVGRTQRCPYAHAIADAGGLDGRRTSLGCPRNVREGRRVFQAQQPDMTSEEHRGRFARRRSPPFPCRASALPTLEELEDLRREDWPFPPEDRREVTPDETVRMVAHEGAPTLALHAWAGTSLTATRQVLSDRSRRYLQAEREPQLVGDALLAPRQILPSHLANKRPELRRNGWSSPFGGWLPQQSPALTAPPLERLGLHDGQSGLPVEPIGEPYQQETMDVLMTVRVGVARLIQGELMF